MQCRIRDSGAGEQTSAMPEKGGRASGSRSLILATGSFCPTSHTMFHTGMANLYLFLFVCLFPLVAIYFGVHILFRQSLGHFDWLSFSFSLSS